MLAYCRSKATVEKLLEFWGTEGLRLRGVIDWPYALVRRGEFGQLL